MRWRLTASVVPVVCWSLRRTDFGLCHWALQGSGCLPPWSPGCGTLLERERRSEKRHNSVTWSSMTIFRQQAKRCGSVIQHGNNRSTLWTQSFDSDASMWSQRLTRVQRALCSAAQSRHCWWCLHACMSDVDKQHSEPVLTWLLWSACHHLAAKHTSAVTISSFQTSDMGHLTSPLCAFHTWTYTSPALKKIHQLLIKP